MEDYSKIPISNNFMFGKIMSEERRAKPFLEQILGFKIHHIEYIDKEKVIEEHIGSHGIRMDLFVEDGKTVYDCEMQTANPGDLPKRSRYYQSQIDVRILEKGVDYNNLKKSYIIFICTFDPFDTNRYVYSFENICREDKTTLLNDGAIKVFINTKGSVGDVTDAFKDLLKFLDTSEIRSYNNDVTNDLKDALVEARNNEKWRHDYMTVEMWAQEREAKSRKEGIQEGLAIGRELLIKAVNMLNDGKEDAEILSEGIDAETLKAAKTIV